MARALQIRMVPRSPAYVVLGSCDGTLEKLMAELSARPGLRHLGTIEDWEEFTEVSAYEACDVVLLLPSPRDSLPDISRFRNAFPQCAVLPVGEGISPLQLNELLNAGAGGFLLASDPPAEWAGAIRTVSAGEIFVSRALLTDVVRHALSQPRKRARSGVDSLSDAEFAVFRLMGSGLSQSQIATHLEISGKTVETSREHIRDRLGLAGFDALERFARDWVQRHLLMTPGVPEPDSEEDSRHTTFP